MAFCWVSGTPWRDGGLARVFRGGGRGQRRGELAVGEGVEGAEAAGEFASGQLAFAEERAEEIFGAAWAFLGVAFPAAGDEVAVRVVARVCARDDVVETLHLRGEKTQTIETTPGFARMDGVAQGIGAQEVRLFEFDTGSWPDGAVLIVLGLVSRNHFWRKVRENLFGQAHVHDVTGVAAFDQAEGFEVDEAAHRARRRFRGHADATSQPGHGKPEPQLSFHAAMAQKMTIDRTVHARQAQARHEQVVQLFPDEFGIGFFGFHF